MFIECHGEHDFVHALIRVYFRSERGELVRYGIVRIKNAIVRYDETNASVPSAYIDLLRSSLNLLGWRISEY